MERAKFMAAEAPDAFPLLDFRLAAARHFNRFFRTMPYASLAACAFALNYLGLFRGEIAQPAL